MNYWLFKSEPSTFSFEMLKAKGAAGTQWDGVRNYQARNNMRAMQIGDLGFFYHSNEGLDVVGIVEIGKIDEARHSRCGLKHSLHQSALREGWRQ